jgi:hypothetical protein
MLRDVSLIGLPKLAEFMVPPYDKLLIEPDALIDCELEHPSSLASPL